MKKWIFFSILIVITIVGILVNVYLNAVEPVKAAEKEAVQIALKETNLSDFTNFSLYSGEETYYVMTGKNANRKLFMFGSMKKTAKLSREMLKMVSRKKKL